MRSNAGMTKQTDGRRPVHHASLRPQLFDLAWLRRAFTTHIERLSILSSQKGYRRLAAQPRCPAPNGVQKQR